MRRLARALLGLVAPLLAGVMAASGAGEAKAAPASSAAVSGEILRDLSGRWVGIGTLRADMDAPGQRVDCLLDIGWSEADRQLEHRLNCNGASRSFSVTGAMTALSGHPALAGHVSMTNLPGSAFAHSELRGRALYVTILARGTDREEALLVAPDTTLWILVLNRGDRRLSSVIRKPHNSGVAQELLSLSLTRRSGKAVTPGLPRTRGPEERLPEDDRARISRDFIEPPISR